MAMNALTWLFVLFIVSACGAARVSQFDSFASAGIKYADAVPLVFDQAFEAAVRTDTLVLANARAQVSNKLTRLEAIESSNKNLSERLAILNGLKAHMAGLRAYFVALRALAASDADSGITQATRDLTGTLATLNATLAKARIGGAPLSDLVGRAAPIAVAQFRSAALNREFSERASTIERELTLQEAALAAIAATMRADIEAQFAAQDRDRIDLPYVNDGALPSDWNDRRLESFRRRLDMTAVDAAVNAAKSLRFSYIALVENRLEGGGISLLIGDIDKMVMLAESTRVRAPLR